MRASVVGLLVLLATAAHAEPLDLRVKPRANYGFRMRVAQAEAPAPANEPSIAPEEEPYVLRKRKREGERRSLAERVIARVDLGIAVDGSKPSGAPNWDHVRIREAIAADPSLYSSVRGYGFAELYLGTNGIGMASLSTYVSTQTRFARDPRDTITPILSPYDNATDLQTRSIWLESDGLFTSKWLAPVRLRAGRMYMYGPGIVHLDGFMLAWERGWLELSTFNGQRVADFFTLQDRQTDTNDYDRDELVTGSEIRADLRRFGVPIVAGLSSLTYNNSSNSNLSATWVPRKDMVVRSTSRFRNAKLAEQRLVIRSRLSEESTVILDSRLRTRSDWFWDYASQSVDEDLAAKDYLDLGAVEPRLESALIAGTVIAQNVDVLARGAIALDTSGGSLTTTVNPHLPAYVEGGAAVEVRLRRAVGFSGSFLVRDYSRPPPANRTDVVLVPPGAGAGELPARSEMGEESLVEAGMSARYSAGARRFSMQGELYGRRTRWAPLYARREWTETGVEETNDDLIAMHFGGRVSLEAWVSPQVRLRGEYDISTQFAFVPEYRGLKQLRLLLEGTY